MSQFTATGGGFLKWFGYGRCLGLHVVALRGEVPCLVVVIWQSGNGVGDVSVVVVVCLFGFVRTSLGGVLGLLDPVKAFLTGLFVCFDEVAAVVVIEAFQKGAIVSAVALAAVAYRDCYRPYVILCVLAYTVVCVKVLK